MTDMVTGDRATLAGNAANLLAAESIDNAPKIGEILLDRYLIQSLLGRGGFGETFLARNLRLPGEPACVIKRLAPQSLAADRIEIARQQFELEALCLSQLGSHSQIPNPIDYFQLESHHYLVQEYIPGCKLTQLIDRQHFTEAEIETFLQQMLQLLVYIHSHNLIHCDIKPENIILCQTDRRFVLLDFGAVRALNSIGNCPRSDTHSHSIGTPGFAPPEQLANRMVYASDLYALGMTCVYLLTGKHPNQISIDPYTCEPIWADSTQIGRELSEIIGKMLQVSLVDRYQSAAQVLTALENRAIRAKLRTYLDRKHAIANSTRGGEGGDYPAVVHWALGIDL
jgi:serine/threonine protein kinase